MVFSYFFHFKVIIFKIFKATSVPTKFAEDPKDYHQTCPPLHNPSTSNLKILRWKNRNQYTVEQFSKLTIKIVQITLVTPMAPMFSL